MMNNTTAKNSEDTIDLKELFFSLIAQWKLITLCIILSLIVALLYLRVTPDTYSVNALVQVDDGKGTSSAALLGDLSGMIDQKSAAQAEIEILKSRLILGQVIEKLHLNIKIGEADNSLLNRLMSPASYQVDYKKDGVTFADQGTSFQVKQFQVPTQYQDMNLELKFEGQKFSLTNPKDQQVLFIGKVNHNNRLHSKEGEWNVTIFSQSNPQKIYLIKQQPLLIAVDQMLKHFSVAEKGKLTGVLGLNYTGQDQQQITKILNEILVTYTTQNIERQSAESAQTLKFLDQQLPKLKSQLDIAEREFNKFREQYNTVDITKESELYLNQSITLETQKVQLEQQVAEASAKYTNEHPVMQQMQAQLAVINEKLLQLEGTLKKLPELQRNYLQLYREVEVKQELYTNLLNSYQQLTIAKAGEIGNVRIVDTAVEPIQPIAPKKLQILILSIFLGGFIGVLIALLRNMLRSGIKDSSQIENELNLPVYAMVPRSNIQESRLKLIKKRKSIPILAVQNPDDIAIESLRSMRTTIHFALNQAKNNIIMITGSAPEMGKSFIAVNLATILAQTNKRVLIIDADLRRGYMHKYFDDQNKSGLSEYLMYSTTADSIIRQTHIKNLDFISRGKSPATPSELLSSDHLKDILADLSTKYDHIIIDTPPVLAVTDASIIAQYTGINIAIARYGKTQIKELELLNSRFEQAGLKLNGVVLNDIQRSSNSYGYGYNYSYNYKSIKED